MRNKFFKTTVKKHWITGCVLALVFFIALPAAAEQAEQKDADTYEQQQQQQQQQQTSDISNEQIQKAAECYIKITEVREQYQDQFAQAESTEEAQNLQAKINEEITDAVEENGMTVEQYNEVVTAAQTDENLRADLLDRISKMSE